ncbi:MAG: ACP S-malonyltransferase [bacterium]|nr:MAG: ACP S-malonyltransferase [bacterium]
MGRELAQWSPAARETLEEADDTLRFALTRLLFEGPEEDLRLTENTQPAILAVSVAAHRVLAGQVDLEPSFVAGHSLGEYSALVAARSLSFPDAIRSVRERGKAMQEAVPAGRGAMAALMGMERNEIESLCSDATDDHGLVSPANYNSPGQVVIAGTRENVLRALDLFKERGGKRAVQLPVSAPFHCSLMEPAARRMEEVLADIVIDSPKTVLINNAEARPLTSADEVVPSLVAQVTSPVLWEDSIQYIANMAVGAFLEVGPGNVLTGLTRRIRRDAVAQAFGRPEDLDAVVAMMEKTD